MDDYEQELSGGNVASEVVRIGDTVRKPATEATASVEAFLVHLRSAGFHGAPRTLGRDDQGRHVLEYIPGSTVDMSQPLSESELHRLGRFIRELHTAAESFVPPASARWNVAIWPDGETLICHHDLAPWNLVRNPEDDRWVFIDWDGSGPGSRLWDLAYAAQGFLPLIAGGQPARDAQRLSILVNAYCLDPSERERLPRMLADRTQAMYLLLKDGTNTGRQPWARLYAEGHADYWKSAADYIQANEAVWHEALVQA